MREKLIALIQSVPTDPDSAVLLKEFLASRDPNLADDVAAGVWWTDRFQLWVTRNHLYTHPFFQEGCGWVMN